MMQVNEQAWAEANQRYLAVALREVRASIERAGEVDGQTADLRAQLDEIGASLPVPPALGTIERLFDLSPFERSVLLLCAGVELDTAFAEACAAAAPDRSARPTFGFALGALPDAHWSAITPEAPLRRWRLVDVAPGGALTTSTLRIDEGVLHFLAGLAFTDEKLAGVVAPLRPDDASRLAESQRRVATLVEAQWADADERAPVVQLCGRHAMATRAVAVAVASAMGARAHALDSRSIPADPHELDELSRRWERFAALAGSVLLIELDDACDASRVRAATRLLESMPAPALLSARERIEIEHRPSVSFDVRKPTQDEQRGLWMEAIGAEGGSVDAGVDRLVSHFDLDGADIRSAVARVHAGARNGHVTDALWAACRAECRPRLDGLAQRIEPVATWDTLVLSERQSRTLRDAALHVRRRRRVYEEWGFSRLSSRGLGISALFAGESGTGKTTAAEVLANELDLDLYVIDLSRVVSKYIGETEKNLGRVFDAAEDGGVILLFDEADALFGKRSEVKDSHDRYANIEVSYLLQRMESYRGLAILTTNRKQAIDDAFLRRIRFVVTFPFPDAKDRAEIWRRAFPPATPTEGLDIDRLARLNVSGGHIRNIALHGAFLAAEEGGPVRMRHVLDAARREYAKLERPLTSTETRGWE